MDSERPPWTRCALFSIAIHFPKLDVAGSIPVSRSFGFSRLASSSIRRLPELDDLIANRPSPEIKPKKLPKKILPLSKTLTQCDV